MTLFKRNLWTLFCVVVAVGVLVLSYILTSMWRATLSKQESHHQARVQLISQSVTNVLRTQELILDVAAAELVRSDLINSTREVLPLLDSIMEASPALAGFGMALPDGQLVKVTSTVDISLMPNLLEQETSREGFRRAMESDRLIVGRTYFLPAVNAWIIPARKAVRNDKGEVIAVMSAGIRADGEKGVFGSKLHAGPDDAVMIFREYDGYMQFMSGEGVTPEIFAAIYRTPEQREADRQNLLKANNATLEVLKARPVPSIYFNQRGGDRYIGGAWFSPEYELWIASESNIRAVWSSFLERGLVLLMVFVALFVLLFYLVRQIDRAEARRRSALMYQSRHDDLTSLLNRVGLIDQIQHLVNEGEKFGVVLLDIDNFRGINDRFGQEQGDKVLAEFARCLQKLASDQHGASRLGGDEFALISRIREPDKLLTYCNDLLRALAREMASGPLKLQLGASLGAAVFPDHGDSFNRIVRSAHLALYQAKRTRNDVCLYRHDYEAGYLRRVHIEQRLRGAINQMQITMAYQPQLDTHSRVVGVEALARWNDEELGYVPPNEFVEVAESCGLIAELGNYVLSRSLADFRKLLDQVREPLDLSVNISAMQFMQAGFGYLVLSELKKHGVHPHYLTLEITETVFMSGFDQVIPILEQLRNAGVSLSMDDFGTGYSSLSLLRKLPIDELKIDKSFVDNIIEDESARNMVESIIAIGQNHRMRLVAEGVEERAQFSALVAMGCGRFQGYLFSRPIPVTEVASLVKHFNSGVTT
ncbi:putative bifunctional diguanylate cyclase/phosphodiesterase [Marinobacter halophilus]|uniref:Bifunctional diguanylate cyclase/phosphodiesterase n=1 Tax=Marinobacter halophilus TaxID=1323740 RepID=A0A2T1KBK7_9GAMM|nr:EAL domain-containing protein [Marinobacter halophilus]PSF07514.1 bifunctional diguanylate cyclase/phosphodiesterase [Marinobacter halophilus]GGC80264.1 GGDEF-domain containing protein [Marinobacter halophilus]